MKKILTLLAICICSQTAYAYADFELVEDMRRCGGLVHADTLKALIKTESRNNPFAVADAGPVALPWRLRKHMVRSFYPSNSEDAVKLAKRLIADGHTVSLGLTQLNDRNLATFGISIEDAFDPCTNIKHGTQLFAQYYRDALQKFKNIPQALEAALSKYNSGDYYRGKNDGYVDLIYKNAGIKNVHYASEHRNDKKPLVHKEKVFTLGMVNHDSEQ